MAEIHTIDTVVDEYLLQRGIDKKKYYAGYLNMAKYVWKKIFSTSIFAVQSEWVALENDEPYNSIKLPKDLVRLFSVSVDDRCGNIVPLYYNQKVNIIAKPKVSSCGCGVCNCSSDGLCNDVNTMIKTSKYLFTVGATDYYEQTWTEFCKNGDVIEYNEIPTKKYNDFVGDGGDFNADYNNDYLKNHPPFSNFTIVTEKTQRTLCKLDVKPCGCPKDTPENENLLFDTCGHYLCSGSKKRKHCANIKGDINSNHKGSVKVSDCGTKVYYIPDKGHHNHLPDYLLVNYQTSGIDCKTIVQIPDYAVEAMFYGIDWYSKRFNTTINWKEKLQVKWAFNNAESELIMFLNPLSIEELSTLQDAKILF